MSTIHPLEALKQNPFVLAPMAGITDHAFRTFMRELGAGVVVTELISATGINYESKRTLDLMSFDEIQRPVGIQLFGDDPADLAKAAQVAEAKNCDFIDLNFGCPVPKVTKKGAGSAMLKDLPQMQKVLSAVKGAVKIPVTIKIRTGWDQTSRNADDVVQLAYDEGITWVAIHGRTRAQGYSGDADWDYIAQVKAKAKLPILGNGDIVTAEQAVNRLKQSGCDGVLIGRGALKNPYIFADALRILKMEQRLDGSGELQPTFDANKGARDFANLFERLAECVTARCDERITQIQLKKFAAWYATGYPGAAHFRKAIFQVKETPEILKTAKDFFEGLRQHQQEDTSHEPFLMGGHG